MEVALGYSEVNRLREREDASICPLVYCVLLIYSITVSVQYIIEFHTSGSISSSPSSFPIFNFSYY